MNALIGVGFVAGICYGILVDGTYFKIYFAVLALYTVVCNYLSIDKKHFTKRKNINVTSWSGKSVICHIKYQPRGILLPTSLSTTMLPRLLPTLRRLSKIIWSDKR